MTVLLRRICSVKLVLRRLAGEAWLVALLAAAAGTEAPAAAPPRKDATADRLAKRLCEALQGLPTRRKNECCGSTLSSLAAACTKELTGALARGAVALEAASVERCAADAPGALEGCDWVAPALPKPPESCRGLVQGRVGNGGACRSSLECPDGLFCRGSSPGRDGVCAAPVEPGRRCETPADSLAAFTRADDDRPHPSCDGVCVKGECIALAIEGAACRSSTSCRTGLACVDKRCVEGPLPRVGESCPGGTSCGAGAYCGADGRCAPVKAAGAPCRLPVECRSLACVTAPGAGGGRCADPCGPGPGRSVTKR